MLQRYFNIVHEERGTERLGWCYLVMWLLWAWRGVGRWYLIGYVVPSGQLSSHGTDFGSCKDRPGKQRSILGQKADFHVGSTPGKRVTPCLAPGRSGSEVSPQPLPGTAGWTLHWQRCPGSSPRLLPSLLLLAGGGGPSQCHSPRNQTERQLFPALAS